MISIAKASSENRHHNQMVNGTVHARVPLQPIVTMQGTLSDSASWCASEPSQFVDESRLRSIDIDLPTIWSEQRKCFLLDVVVAFLCRRDRHRHSRNRCERIFPTKYVAKTDNPLPLRMFQRIYRRNDNWQ